MSKILIPLRDAPGVIRESARTTLDAHGFKICRVGAAAIDGRMIAVRLTEEQLHAFLVELGNNLAQALVSIDETPLEDDQDLDLDLGPEIIEGGKLLS